MHQWNLTGLWILHGDLQGIIYGINHVEMSVTTIFIVFSSDPALFQRMMNRLIMNENIHQHVKFSGYLERIFGHSICSADCILLVVDYQLLHTNQRQLISIGSWLGTAC